jgi:hypothetical protein
MRTVGLKARDGIGQQTIAAVETKPIARAGGRIDETAEVSAVFSAKRGGLARLEDDVDALRGGRPHAHVRLSVAQILGADWKASCDCVWSRR